MAGEIFVIAENRKDDFARAAYEAVSLAKKIAQEASTGVQCLVMGPEAAARAEKMAQFGADVILTADAPELDQYVNEAWVNVAAAVIEQRQPALVILGATAMGKDLAPRLAARLNAGLAMDCISLEKQGDAFSAVKPMYGGKILAEVEISGSPAVAAIRPNVFRAEENPGAGAVEAVSADLGEVKTEIVEAIDDPSDKIELTEADVIVSGGRGMGGADFAVLEDLAKALGAGVGASRAAVDEGWRPHTDQVGQTGKTVSPSLYVACGISGAIQHLAGMSGSKCIVAINKDPEAPVFAKADFGIAGDLFEVVPEITKAVKEAKA